MKYMGSKARIAPYILPIILKSRKPGQWYVEPFAGGMNSMAGVTGNRLAGDSNTYLIALWKALLSGWMPPKITREDYYRIRDNKDTYSDFLVGWAGICCSYCGKWFDGFSGEVTSRAGTLRDYQEEALRNLRPQIASLMGVSLVAADYRDLPIPPRSIIYCDPPYEGHRGYRVPFDHVGFWSWCGERVLEGHTLFVSGYRAPGPFRCVWQGALNSSLSANGKTGGSRAAIERLFSLSWADLI